MIGIFITIGFSVIAIALTWWLTRNHLRKNIQAHIKQYLQLIDLIDALVVVFDPKGKILYANLKHLNFSFRGDSLPFWISYKGKRAELFEIVKYLQTLDAKTPQTLLVDLIPKKDETSSKVVSLSLEQSLPSLYTQEKLSVVLLRTRRNVSNPENITRQETLSGLPSQTLLEHTLSKMIARRHHGGAMLGLMLFQIDNFSMLRSIIGFEQTNTVLGRIGDFLSTLKAEGKFDIDPFQTQENYFALIVQFGTQEHLQELIDTIQQGLKRFYRLEDLKLYLTASVGVVIYQKQSLHRLMDLAYAALDRAQKQGYGRVEIIGSGDLNVKTYDEFTLHSQMQKALREGEFEVFYQPIVRAHDEVVIGAEALLRWRHPDHGMLPPDVFIPIMEKTGFIIEAGGYVLEKVLKQIRRWEMFRFNRVVIALNVSLVELESGDFEERLMRLLQQYRVDPSLIRLEITESQAMENGPQIIQSIHTLKKLGVTIALDDFGSGFTSFAYLKQFPADVLKIDKSLVEHIQERKEDQKIVQAMIDMAHHLGMKVVVEGIENEEICDKIRSYGGDLMQGYHFSAPLPVFEFQKLIRDDRASMLS